MKNVKSVTLENHLNVLENLKYGEKKIRDLCRKMNLGAGFNGFTPDFFANLKGQSMSE